MTLRHFHIFIEVVKQQSMTRASKVLLIAQPSISLAIKELEDYYQVKLFHRMKKKLELTSQGLYLYEQLLSVMTLLETTSQVLKEDQEHELKVGFSLTIGTAYLPKYLSSHEKVITQIDNSHTIINNVLNGQLDFGFIETPIKDKELIIDPIASEELIVFSNQNSHIKKHLTLEELTDYPLILRDKLSGTRAIIDHYLRMNHLEYVPIIESSNSQALIEFVRLNLGISILPSKLIPVNEFKLHVLDTELHKPFYFIVHKNRYLSPYAHDWIDAFSEYLKKEALEFKEV